MTECIILLLLFKASLYADIRGDAELRGLGPEEGKGEDSREPGKYVCKSFQWNSLLGEFIFLFHNACHIGMGNKTNITGILGAMPVISHYKI